MEPIICDKCEHNALSHNLVGCSCGCDNSREDVYRSRLSTLEAAVEERTETIGKLQQVLNEVSSLSYDAQGDWVSVTREYSPEWTHVFKEIEDLCQQVLAETAPKVQS